MPTVKVRLKEKYENAAKLLADGKAEDAIKSLREIIAEKPDHVNAMVTLAVALMELQTTPDASAPQTEEALLLLDRAARINPKDPIPLFNRGVCLRKLGQPEKALESFLAALKIQKKLPLALLHVAEINYELGRWETAIDFARKALVRDPGLEGALGWVRDAMSKAGMLADKGNAITKPKQSTTER